MPIIGAGMAWFAPKLAIRLPRPPRDRAMKIRPFGRGYPVDWARMAIIQARRGNRAEALRWLAKAEATSRTAPDRFVAKLVAEGQRELRSLEGKPSSPGSTAR